MIDITITTVIIGITGLVSIQCFSNRELFAKLLFSPYLVKHKKQWYRLFSHGFVHADWMHLIVNMYVLYMFGRFVEYSFAREYGPVTGGVYYILLYLGGLAFASLPSIKKHSDNHYYTSIGASGAVASALFSVILMFPTIEITLLFLPIPMPAFIFGGLYLLFEWYMDKKSTDNVAHDAHFWGAIFGLVFTMTIDYNHLANFIVQIINYFG